VIHNTEILEENKDSFPNLFEVASSSMSENSARSFITKIVRTMHLQFQIIIP